MSHSQNSHLSLQMKNKRVSKFLMLKYLPAPLPLSSGGNKSSTLPHLVDLGCKSEETLGRSTLYQ
jgi:hypothetical protein